MKISEVREIIEEGMIALSKKMRGVDEIITKNSANLRLMESKVKNCISQVNSLQKLSKG